MFKNGGLRPEDLPEVTTGPLAPRPGPRPEDLDEVLYQGEPGAVVMGLDDMVDELDAWREPPDPYARPAFGPAGPGRESVVVDLAVKYLDKLFEIEGQHIDSPDQYVVLAKTARTMAEIIYPRDQESQ